MRTMIISTTKATAVVALVVMAVFSGCTSEDSTTTLAQDAGTQTDALAVPDVATHSVDAAADSGRDALDDSTSDLEASADAPTADVDASGAPDADASTDADGAGALIQPDGTYVWDVWTCGQGGTTKDIKAFAMSLGIQSVVTKITGTMGSVDVVYSATCTRTTVLTSVEYPSPGTIKTTAAGAYTCSATCLPDQCAAGTQAVIADTFSLAAAGDTYTYTRVLDAAYLANITLQKAAGCVAGDTEIATRIKQ
jgi:hypothetical protein